MLTPEGIYDLAQVIEVMIQENEGVKDVKQGSLCSKGKGANSKT